MALEQQTDLKNGLQASYWKLVEWSVNLESKTATATFKVYVDRTQSQNGRPASDKIARLDISGADFDQWFTDREQTVRDQEVFYTAAKALGVNSDFGSVRDPADQQTKRGNRPLFRGAKDMREDRKKPKRTRDA